MKAGHSNKTLTVSTDYLGNLRRVNCLMIILTKMFALEILLRIWEGSQMYLSCRLLIQMKKKTQSSWEAWWRLQMSVSSHEHQQLITTRNSYMIDCQSFFLIIKTTFTPTYFSSYFQRVTPLLLFLIPLFMSESIL